MLARHRWQIKTISVLDEVYEERCRLEGQLLIQDPIQMTLDALNSGDRASLIRAAALLIHQIEAS